MALRPLGRLIRWLLAASLAAVCGCNLLAYPLYLTAPEPVRKVPAEFDKLPGKTVAVVVWAEPATLFQFPHIRLEVAAQVAYQLGRHIKDTHVVEPQQVADYQDRHPNWASLPPAELGKKFGADYVIFIELLKYTTRDPKSPALFRGRATASVAVYDANEPSRRWTLTQAVAQYPARQTGLISGDDMSVHRRLLEQLGIQIARKFYDHEVKVQGS